MTAVPVSEASGRRGGGCLRMCLITAGTVLGGWWLPCLLSLAEAGMYVASADLSCFPESWDSSSPSPEGQGQCL